MGHNSTSEDSTTTVLQGRILDVEKSINKISSLREELEENSKNVKAEVQASIGIQLHHLRQREIQLLRQVDALISHQSCLLQLQLSRLYQSLGALRSTLQWVGQGGNVDLSKIGEVTLDPIQTSHLHYKPISLTSLESSIRSFGRVEAKGASANVLMLPEEEDYGDGDHHVLHKALDNDLASIKIKMNFPKISSSSEDWLSVLKGKAEDGRSEGKNLSNEESTKGEKWLCDLERQFDLNDFEMTEVSEASEESIELLSHPDMYNNNDLWLQSPCHPKDQKSNCNCIDYGNVEIENLDTLSCIPNKADNYNRMLSVPEVSTVCRSGNSKCKTFNECVCEENCLVTCLKEQMKDLKVEEITKQDCINEVIRATTCLQQKQQNAYDWLAQKDTQTVNDWLKIRTQSWNPANVVDDWLKICRKFDRTESPISNEWLENRVAYERNCRFEMPASLIGFEAASWIKSSINAGSTNCKVNVKDSPCETEPWLASIKTEVVAESLQAKAMKEMFERYFQQQMLGNWVSHNSARKVQI